jgi:glycosyltransferase involved in cell wall biosynthesis
MPEVAGDTALFADPLNVAEIQKGLTKILTDKNFASTLSSTGPAQAAKFSWDVSAEKLTKLLLRLADQSS